MKDNKESHALKHTTLRRRTTYLNLLERVDGLFSSSSPHFPSGCLWPPPQGEIAVLEGGPVSGLQELECGPRSLASLFLLSPDRQQADAPITDQANSPVSASRFRRFGFLVEFQQAFQRYPSLSCRLLSPRLPLLCQIETERSFNL